MINLKYLVLVILLSAIGSCSNNKNTKSKASKSNKVVTTFNNPLYDGADPWMIKHNNKYYTCYSDGNNLSVSESKFLTIKENDKIVFTGTSQDEKLHSLWAPELHFVKEKWYIYYAAAKREGTPFTYQRARVLESENPFGPYTDKGVVYTGDDYNNQTPANNIWAIDMNVFVYNSKWYAIWSGWEKQANTDKTPQHTYIAELINPWKLGKRVLISVASEEWEKGEEFALQEGQEVLKHNDNLFIVYSTRGSWTKHYKLGLLKLIGHDPLNPDAWEKHGPVFQGTELVYGVGHASFV
ncbi:MAG: glycoside hydrolase family 43 protein, partial [Bacteroidales bacterium]|nr:glycoside hydrolase family 43 protein [Bacteroidales bacterium]